MLAVSASLTAVLIEADGAKWADISTDSTSRFSYTETGAGWCRFHVSGA